MFQASLHISARTLDHNEDSRKHKSLQIVSVINKATHTYTELSTIANKVSYTLLL